MKNLVLAVILISITILSACEKTDSDSTYQETEENGSFATANELSQSNTFDAEINPQQDQDYFVVNTTSSISITVDGDNNLELYVNVYDENEVQIFGGDTGARGASLTQAISSDDFNGQAYIFIESAYPDDTGSYTIKFE